MQNFVKAKNSAVLLPLTSNLWEINVGRREQTSDSLSVTAKYA